MKLNEVWHRGHPMPNHPTMDDRIAWHRAHAQACGCREIPPGIRKELAKRTKEPD